MTKNQSAGFSIVENTEILTFANGLRLFVCPNRKAPNVTVQVWMETGSNHEQENLGCGLSHFLEHMLFSGTEKYPGKTEIADRTNDLGVRLNAWTSYTNTVYYMDGPSSAWMEILSMLCDMVRAPLFPEDSFEKEKNVILRECAMRSDNPDTVLFEQLLMERFKKNPMRYPVIGLREGIESVNRDMMTAYYAKRYSPHRCFIIVTGDVDAKAVADQTESLLGGWKRGPLAEPFILQDEPVPFPKCVVRTFPDPIARCAQGFLLPASSHSDIPVLEALATILGGFDSSRLILDLRTRKSIVMDAGCFLYKGPDAGVMFLNTESEPGKVSAACSGMTRVIESVRKNGVTREETERTLHSLKTAKLGIFRSNTMIAGAIGRAVLNFGTIEALDRYDTAIARLTQEDIRAAAEKYLSPDCVVELRLQPKASPSRKKVVSSAAGYRSTIHTFPDGQKSLYVPDSASPFAGICIALHGGELYETKETAEFSDLLTDGFYDGADGLSEEQFAAALDNRSIRLDVASGINGILISLDCLKEDFEEGLRLLVSMLAKPEFPEDKLARDRDDLVQSIESDRKDPRKSAFSLIDTLMFEDGSPSGYPQEILTGSLKNMSVTNLRKFYENTVLSADGSVIAAYGALSVAEAKDAVSAIRSGIAWNKNRAERLDNMLQRGRADASEILPREQAVVVLALPCPDCSRDAFSVPLDILNNALTGMSSNLFKNIREKEGLAYYTSFRLMRTLSAGYMSFFAGTSPASADRVLEKFEEERKRLAEQGLTEAEFNAARTCALYSLSTVLQDVASYVGLCTAKVYLGGKVSILEDRIKALERADFRKVNRTLRELFNTEDIKRAVVSPKKYTFQ